MRYPKEQKEETRTSILNAALHTFRAAGYNGIGVDGIAKAANLTSGAFYKHLGSKSQAFRMAISEGLAILNNAILDSQREHGQRWLSNFTDWYFSRPKTGEDGDIQHPSPMQGGCALPTLSPEVPRTDEETQKLYDEKIQEIVATISTGLPQQGSQSRELAWTVLALMIGGVVLARSTDSEDTALEVSESVLSSIRKLSN
jgi:AcrR family transcriptional regulator